MKSFNEAFMGNPKAIELINSKLSPRQILLRMQVRDSTVNYKHLKNFCESNGLPYNLSKYSVYIRYPSFEDSLVENSTQKISKKRLVKEGLLEAKCYGPGCQITADWLGSPITLQLDHINGKSNDNRLSNLRFLCPNCHSQQETSNKRKTFPNNPKKVCECGGKKHSQAIRCRKCNSKIPKSTKIEWPDKEKLNQMVSERGYLSVGKELGVSDNSVRKRLNKR